MIKYIFTILLFGLTFACDNPTKSSTSTAATENTPNVSFLEESQAAKNTRMQWWRDARFGMFIHWGVYALLSGEYQGKYYERIGEWIMDTGKIPIEKYEEFAREFNPTQFDAREWVNIAKDAGMKYIVITSKHHDGFCLWDSDVTEYDIVDFTNYKKDILGQLAEACQEAGIKLGFYYSIMDWHHPDAQAPNYPNYNPPRDGTPNPNFPRYYNDYMKPQLKELVEKYDPAILWFDGEWIPDYTHEQGLDLYQFIRSLKPDILINNRVDKGRQGMQGMNKNDQQYVGDFGTPEQEILESTSTFDWEACMTMNDTWGFKAKDQNWKTAETLIHNLADISAKGGNFLLNVGPSPEGKIPEPSIERLGAMGDWVEVNQEAIYNTQTLEPYMKDGLRFTGKNNVIYAIDLQWPGTSLMIESVTVDNIQEVKMLGVQRVLDYSNSSGLLQIQIPSSLQNPDNRPCNSAWTYKISYQ